MSMRGADLLVRCLEAEGVDRIFGIPGEENLDLVDALIDSSIEFVVTKHEEGASLMADISGRLTQRPGVCLSTLGPGATNLVTGVADAFLSHVPMIALTGQVRRERCAPPQKQYLDLVRLFEPVSKHSMSLRDPVRIAEEMRRAFDIAVSEKPGPVHIELPEDVMKENVTGEPIPSIERMSLSADGAELDALCDLIMNCKQPLIMAGHGVVRKNAERELRMFAEEWNIPVAMTWMGTGAVPFDNPLSLHTVGLRKHDFMRRAFQHADLVILVGYDIHEFLPVFWNTGTEKRIAHVGPLPAELVHGLCPDVQVVGDLKLTLSSLSSPATRRKNWTIDLRKELHSRMDDLPPDEGLVKPQLAVRKVRDSLDREDIAICDVGAHLLWMMKLYPVYKENTLIASNGLIPMGLAVPGAIAAKLVHPERKVVAVCGDGGFMMTSCELETAMRLRTPFIAVVFNDSGFGLIAARQRNTYGREYGVKFGNPDLVKYAESFGAIGYRASSAQELGELLANCLDEDVPCVIDVPVDYAENAKLTQ
ncbi:MAG TPA: acetolactate synthase large subunit [Methanomassiliicoccales archaeon]|nr:acetolactate synthase large subunit [Methanomassiliicoccales archaeon]